jgi:hypothetical protein
LAKRFGGHISVKREPYFERKLDMNYYFGLRSYVDVGWIGHKRVFVQPVDVSVEFSNTQTFEWMIADGFGRIVRTIRVNQIRGWTSINLPSLGLNQNYSIGFRSIVPARMLIKKGEVTFGPPSLQPIQGPPQPPLAV